MPYCNVCGKYITDGMLCPYCARVSPDDGAYPVPDGAESTGGEDTAARGAAPATEGATAEGEETAETEEETETPSEGAAETEGEAAEAPAAEPAPALNEALRHAYTRVLATADTTDRYAPRDVRAHRCMAALAYLGVFWAIPFFFARSSRFVRFHLGQGLLLLLLDGIAATLLGITLLLSEALPAVAPALAAVIEVMALLSLAWKLFGVICACRGRARELPLIGACADAA